MYKESISDTMYKESISESQTLLEKLYKGYKGIDLRNGLTPIFRQVISKDEIYHFLFKNAGL